MSSTKKVETISLAPTTGSLIMLAVGSGRHEILTGLVNRLEGGETLPQEEVAFIAGALKQVLKLGAEATDRANTLQEKLDFVMDRAEAHMTDRQFSQMLAELDEY